MGKRNRNKGKQDQEPVSATEEKQGLVAEERELAILRAEASKLNNGCALELDEEERGFALGLAKNFVPGSGRGRGELSLTDGAGTFGIKLLKHIAKSPETSDKDLILLMYKLRKGNVKVLISKLQSEGIEKKEAILAEVKDGHDRFSKKSKAEKVQEYCEYLDFISVYNDSVEDARDEYYPAVLCTERQLGCVKRDVFTPLYMQDVRRRKDDEEFRAIGRQSVENLHAALAPLEEFGLMPQITIVGVKRHYSVKGEKGSLHVGDDIRVAAKFDFPERTEQFPDGVPNWVAEQAMEACFVGLATFNIATASSLDDAGTTLEFNPDILREQAGNIAKVLSGDTPKGQMQKATAESALVRTMWSGSCNHSREIII